MMAEEVHTVQNPLHVDVSLRWSLVYGGAIGGHVHDTL
jgi:hypothetical protein